MAGRYSRFHSNYILKKKHQTISTGTIWERDWVTIGAKHQIEKGKRPFFGDSGFLYTINNIPTTKKRHDFGKWVGNWFYPDVENAQETVNSVEVNYLSNDIRDFVYYGSCTELIRSSVLNIIENYPAVLTNFKNLDPFHFYREEEGVTYDALSPGLKLMNPFGVDLIHTEIDSTKVNVNRFLAVSYPNFDIYITDINTGESFRFDEITDYNVTTNDYYHKKSGYGITADVYENMRPEILKENYRKIDYSLPQHCNYYINTVDVSIRAFSSSDSEKRLDIKLKGFDFGDEFIFCLHEGLLRLNNDSGRVFSYAGGGNPVINATLTMKPEIYIYPKQHIKDVFFDNLDEFQKLLLRDDTKPLYKNTFLTPYETETGMYYTYMDYVWPSYQTPYGDTVLEITSPIYYEYIDNLYKLGSSLDELWCDNLWRNMTHESIKNYDWTYRRTFEEGEEEDNIIGGQRMEHIIRIYGRVFDDLKRYVDGIRLTTKVTYDGRNNRPEAELSDKLDYMGWDIFSTIPVLSDIVKEDDPTVIITQEEYDNLPEEEKDDYVLVSEDLSDTVIDNEYIQSNGLKWFRPINNNTVTASLEDNAFMRALSLSSKYILKSKGTIDSIEMILALFGFGIEETFDVTEHYHYIIPEQYDEKRAKQINDLAHRDSISKSYDEDQIFMGLPLNIKDIYNNNYIIPFYDSRRYYEGEFGFQTKGGWGADNDDSTRVTEFMETLSYLKVVGNITELLSLNPFDVNKDDIYYVIDLSDITKYDEGIGEEDLEHFTHFYYCNNDVFVERYSSWTNIKDNDGSAYYDKAMYLDSIISTDIGNNPHVGYGLYDLGQEYLNYMNQPFFYILNNYSLDEDTRSDMEDLEFFVSERLKAEDMHEKLFDFQTKSEERDKFFAKIRKERDEIVAELKEKSGCVGFDEIIILENKAADLNAILNSVRYYLNSKVIILTNKVGTEVTETYELDGETVTRTYVKIDENYRKYFFDTMLPYIMQVIPSTAILVLKDFN